MGYLLLGGLPYAREYSPSDEGWTIQNEGEKPGLQTIGGNDFKAMAEPCGDFLGKGDNCMSWL